MMQSRYLKFLIDSKSQKIEVGCILQYLIGCIFNRYCIYHSLVMKFILVVGFLFAALNSGT